MENEALQLNAHPLVAIALMAAVPVVIFAIWADLFDRLIEALKKEGDEIDTVSELRRVRWASIVAFLGEGAVYVLATPIREKFYLPSLAIFCAALMVQSWIQSGLEGKLRKLPARPAAQAKWLLRSTAWIMANLAVYFGWIWASFAVAYRFLEKSPFGGETRVALLLAAGIIGIFSATFLLMALAPVHIRNMIPNYAFQETELRARLEACFRDAGFEPPQMAIMDTEDFKYSNAVIAGFPGAKGIFKPILLLSASLMKGLSDEELVAVVKHEVSHWSLKHLKRRVGAVLASIIGTTLLFGSMLALAAIALPQEGQALIRLLTTALSVILPFWLIRSQTRLHETEADIYTVTRLGADLEAYASALRKLDRMNDLDSNGVDPFSSIGVSGGHPATELRILRIRTFAAAEKATRSKVAGEIVPATKASDDKDQAA
ncbi:MAG: M48 family metalloprotease [Bdellovibrionales bacterium]|nr:M48 family metalloprotease [Bdellovibrionales bacterium]